MGTLVRRAWIAVAAMIASAFPCAAQPAPPPITSPDWFTWYDALLSERLAACPRERSQTFYFSQSGDDVTGSGTIANPWKTIAKARQVIEAAAPNGDVAVLFRRGDIWREPGGLEVTTPRVTIADYGVGEKPLFTVFTSVGDPAEWSVTHGYTNVYQRPAPVQVMWAKQDDDLDRPWSRQRTIAGVSTVEGSWCWIEGVLYVHPRHAGGQPTDPRVDGNAYETAHETWVCGVRVRGNGSRIENIRAQGWGLTTVYGSQKHGIESAVQGADAAVVVGCESHYGLTHAMTHWSPEGGKSTFVGCKAGLTTYSGIGGETVFNTYAYLGGNQTIFDSCEATHGTLPSDDYPAGTRRAMSFYGHTSVVNAVMALTIAKDCIARDTTHGCATPAGFSDVPKATTLESVRCFIVGERAIGGPGLYWAIAPAGTARVNCIYSFIPTFGEWMNAYSDGWILNCRIDLDCTGAAGDFAFLASTFTSECRLRAWNCDFRIRTRPGQTFRFDRSTPSFASESVVGYSVIAGEGGGTIAPNLPAPSPVRRKRGQPANPLRSNAYFGVDPADVQRDPYAVVLDGPPGETISCTSKYVCGATPLLGAVVMEYDIRGLTGDRNDIGPLEVFVCANCDGSTVPPVLTALDYTCFLNKFTLGDPAANCDGSTVIPILTAQDFICFQEAFARGCR